MVKLLRPTTTEPTAPTAKGATPTPRSTDALVLSPTAAIAVPTHWARHMYACRTKLTLAVRGFKLS
jgi:hypothetical protein